MLFADESSLNGGTVLTAISMMVTTVVGFLSTRAGMIYAAERRDMKSQIENLTTEHRKCEEAHRDTLKDLEIVRQKCEEAEQRSARRDGEIQGINELVAGLKQELTNLRALVYNRTTNHVE